MTDMIICGLSMEMELAKEMGWVGKCIGCRRLDYDGKYEYCDGKILKEHKEDCDKWIVDIR